MYEREIKNKGNVLTQYDIENASTKELQEILQYITQEFKNMKKLKAE